jgi:hypothetical protein
MHHRFQAKCQNANLDKHPNRNQAEPRENQLKNPAETTRKIFDHRRPATLIDRKTFQIRGAIPIVGKWIKSGRIPEVEWVQVETNA